MCFLLYCAVFKIFFYVNVLTRNSSRCLFSVLHPLRKKVMLEYITARSVKESIQDGRSSERNVDFKSK